MSSELSSAFLSEARSTPLLTRAEEVELSDAIRKGDATARERFVKANLRLVIKIAYQYVNLRVLPLSDLIQVGSIGLLHAVEKFDPRHHAGGKFSTYAAWWIKQAMHREMANHGRTIRIPVHVVSKVLKLRRWEVSMSEDLGRDPTVDELAAATGFKPANIELWRTFYLGTVSLDAPLGDGEDDRKLADYVADPGGSTGEQLSERTEELALMQSLLVKIDARSRTILERRYGLNGRDAETLDQIGTSMNLTRERIRQLQNKALTQLRELRRKHELVSIKQVAAEAFREAKPRSRQPRSMLELH